MCFLNIKACQHILLHQIHKIMIFKKSYDPFKDTSLIFEAQLSFAAHQKYILCFFLIVMDD